MAPFFGGDFAVRAAERRRDGVRVCGSVEADDTITGAKIEARPIANVSSLSTRANNQPTPGSILDDRNRGATKYKADARDNSAAVVLLSRFHRNCSTGSRCSNRAAGAA